jgi:AAA family ATP:ADP antiporter
MAEATAQPGDNFLERLVRVEHGEWPRLLIAFSYFFFLLGGYFMLRPIRGTVASNNSEILHLLYTGTFITMLAIVPVFGFLVSRFKRGQFIPASYLFFIGCLVFFILGFRDEETPQWIQRTFYIWLSVFNLFVVSVFWSFMTDVFRPGQAQRLFGVIMAGGSLGSIVGPLITSSIVTSGGSRAVMIAAGGCFLVATGLAIFLGRYESTVRHEEPEVIGGGVWQGAIRVFRSRYLLYACLLMLLHNLVSTFLFNGMAVLVNDWIVGFDERTRFFSYLDLSVQVLAFTFQFFITSRLIAKLGMSGTLVLIPALLAGGFILLGSAVGLVLFAAVQVAQRSMNYGVLGPAKEMLFTVVDRELRYKSKNFIDTLSVGQMTWLYLPFMGAWAWGAWRLGKTYQSLRNAQDESSETAPSG